MIPTLLPSHSAKAPCLWCGGAMMRADHEKKGKEAIEEKPGRRPPICYRQGNKGRCVNNRCLTKDRLPEMRWHHCVFAFQSEVHFDNLLQKKNLNIRFLNPSEQNELCTKNL